jgi:hypothetical protein
MENQNKFVVVADGEVIMHFVIHKHDSGATDGMLAGLRSDPKIIELTEESDPSVGFGWKYIDGVFVQPEPEAPAVEEYEVED